MTRNQAAKFLNAATTAVILPGRKPISIDEVRVRSTFPWVRCKLQADGSLYVQAAKESYEVRA